MQKQYNPKEVEARIQKFWKEKNVFRFSKDKKIYSIDTPPATVSGSLHVGHTIGYIPTDFIARFWRMQGLNVFYPMGFDDNGLASERFVEKQLGIKAKNFTRDEFIKICLKETKKGEEEYRNIWDVLGLSVDWSLLYSTMDPLVQKISQMSFVDLYKQGRIYRKEGPVTWCPSCQTAVAQAELEDLQRKTILNTIYFDLKGSKERIEIATTRPELLPACVAVFVNPNDSRYKNLVGKTAIVPIFEQHVKIMTDEKVDPNFGTGIVMVCTFGDKTDIDWWQDYKLELRITLDKEGKLNELGKDFKNLKLDEARSKIIEELKKKGCLIKQESLEQTVNVHERCGTPIEFYISMQWYIRILDLKKKFLELGDKINWYPENFRIRYKQWVEGLNSDWCISRQRYFGIPFPVWHCKKCKEIIIEEKNLPVNPLKTKPSKKCSCGFNEFLPEEDVMDTWATSSLTPLINSKWTMELIPMGLRPQGYDIIRTWAFYTIAKTWLHKKSVPWESIMLNGMGLDSKGMKMSKSKGNVVEPLPLKEKYSSDAIRYWVASTNLGNDVLYQEKDVATGQKLLTKIWNVARFTEMTLKKIEKPKELNVIDKWILTKLNALIKTSTENFKACEYGKAKQETEIFFWKVFCDNYLEMIKHRIYKGDKSAQYTLYKCLLTLLKLFSPIIPHATEEIYQELFKKHEKELSIHTSSWPEPEKGDKKAEELGNMTKSIIATIRQFKHDNKMALNTELKKVTIKCDKNTSKKIEEIIDEIKGAMQVKKIEFGEGTLQVEGFEIKLDAS
jgi:valyl-tRNA synthetase